MVDVVRCQMCGKLNSSDHDVCQYCHARLKPLMAPSDANEVPEQPDITDMAKASPPSEKEDTSLSLNYDFVDESEIENEKEESKDHGGMAEAKDDWISDIRFELKGGTDSLGSYNENGSPEKAETENDGAEDLGADSDWLKRLDEPQVSAHLKEKPAPTVPEATSKAPTIYPVKPEKEDSNPKLDLNAWLDELDEEQFEKTDVESGKKKSTLAADHVHEKEPPSVPSTIGPVKSFGAAYEDNVEAGEAEELPDWLKSLEGDETFAAPVAEEHQPLAESVETNTEANQENEIPEWLNDFDDEQLSSFTTGVSADSLDEPGESQAESLGAIESDGLPDWLMNMEDEQSIHPPPGDLDVPATEAGKVEADSGLAEELPAWLKDLEDDELSAPSSTEQITPSSEPGEVSYETSLDEEIPDWLKNLKEEQPSISPPSELVIAETENVEAGGEPEFVEEISEWQKALDEEQTPTSTPPEPAAPLTESMDVSLDAASEADGGMDQPEDLPEWLKNLQGIQPLTPGTAKTNEPSLETQYEETLPDWLKNIQDAEQIQTMGEASRTETGKEQIEQPSAAEAEKLSSYDVKEIGLPKWQEDIYASTDAEDTDQHPTDKHENLAPTDMPGWLEAMRPDGEITSGKGVGAGMGVMENAGPLAGFHGILPIHAIGNSVKKPPAYALKMRLSKQQKENAAILSKMLALEEEAAPVSLPSPVVSQRLVRWVIAFFLLLASLIPIVTGSQQMPLPIPSSEIQQVSQLVETIKPGTPVLLAIDYEPGLSGEMDAAASAVIGHLMVRGASLILVSSSPTGPVLGERFIQKIQIEHQYKSGQQYFNLGYIPGGATGLLSFAGLPQRTMPYTLDGAPAWNQAPLQNIKKLSDFPMVVVVVDDPETARKWVEQVGPFLGKTPLIMVISAQAEPMVRPYYDGKPGQIQGIVVGLSGGSAYERMTGLNGLGRKYWDAFGLELLLVVTIIWVGALVSGVLYIKDWRKAEKANKGTKTRGVAKGSI